MSQIIIPPGVKRRSKEPVKDFMDEAQRETARLVRRIYKAADDYQLTRQQAIVAFLPSLWSLTDSLAEEAGPPVTGQLKLLAGIVMLRDIDQQTAIAAILAQAQEKEGNDADEDRRGGGDEGPGESAGS